MRLAHFVLTSTVVACHHSPAYHELTLGTPPLAMTGGEDGSGSGVVSTGDVEVSSSSSTDFTSTLGDSSSSATSDSPDPPQIIAVDFPNLIEQPGPVQLTVTCEGTMTVRAWIDDVALGELAADDQVFTRTVPILGAIDSGMHTLRVEAESGELAASPVEHLYSVQVAAPGTQRWADVASSPSRINALAVTSAGDVLEAGSVELEGKPRPSLRLRSRTNGLDVWPEGRLVLDARPGAAVDVVAMPDDSIWVALTVFEGGVSHPRIIHLEPSGHEHGVELPVEPGASVTSLARDAGGGLLAAGYQPTGLGDTDLVLWRADASGAPSYSAKTWDYAPAIPGHEFDDLALDIVVTGIDSAWLVGVTSGKHEVGFTSQVRGLLLPIDVSSGDVAGAPVVAAPMGVWRQSAFLGGTLHEDGLAVTGYSMTAAGDVQRIEFSVYSLDGERTEHGILDEGDVAYGAAIAWDEQAGFVLVGQLDNGLGGRGFVMARAGDDYDLFFAADKSPSAATSLAIDPYRQAFVGGYVTSAGASRARLAVIAR